MAPPTIIKILLISLIQVNKEFSFILEKKKKMSCTVLHAARFKPDLSFLNFYTFYYPKFQMLKKKQKTVKSSKSLLFARSFIVSPLSYILHLTLVLKFVTCDK